MSASTSHHWVYLDRKPGSLYKQYAAADAGRDGPAQSPMNLYLDDNSVKLVLVSLQRQAGHDVQLPQDVGRMGSHDAVHLRHAIQTSRVLLSHNHRDFQCLHDLLLDAQGHHPGILVVRRDNDRKRDLTPSGIVRALTNLLAAGVALADHLHVLNHWR